MKEQEQELKFNFALQFERLARQNLQCENVLTMRQYKINDHETTFEEFLKTIRDCFEIAKNNFPEIKKLNPSWKFDPQNRKITIYYKD